MSSRETKDAFWYELWIEVSVLVVLLVSGSCVFSMMRAGGWSALIAGVGWCAYRLKGRGMRWNASTMFRGNWQFAMLAAVCFVSLLAGPHSFIDSFTYRIPQMLLWLQEGHPWAVPHVDFRINQMPHVWSFMGLPFFLLAGVRGVSVPNFISYLLMFRVLNEFARSMTEDSRKAYWMVLVFIASPIMVMQAASNDNVLTCTAFLLISAHFCLLRPVSTRTICYSALAFALCCGIKPQYVTLAPLWAVWFIWGRGVPVKVFQWLALSWLVPLVIICSPVPTLAINFIANGDVLKPNVQSAAVIYYGLDASLVKESFINRVHFSYASLFNQLFALPVNPFAYRITSAMRDAAEKIPWLKVLDFHRQQVFPLLLEENTSLGFLASIALFVGLFRARGSRCSLSWLALGAFISFNVAVCFTLAGSIGRSFVGFLVLMVPLAFFGLSKYSYKHIRNWSIVCLFSGMCVVFLNPAAPLWPVNTVLPAVKNPALRENLKTYVSYASRNSVGDELIKDIPVSVREVGVIAEAGTPTAGLWGGPSLPRHLKFFGCDVDSEELGEYGVKYLIVRHSGLESGDTLSSEFLACIRGEIVKKVSHVAYVPRGPERWFLLKVN